MKIMNMKKYGLYVLAFVVIASLLCSFIACGVKSSLGQEFSLAIGQSATITGENLKITFKEVLEDSRCARDVTCIQAGRIVSLVGITEDGTSQEVILIQPGMTDQHAEETYSDYRFTFGVEPYPEEADKQIKSSEYRLLLTINR